MNKTIDSINQLVVGETYILVKSKTGDHKFIEHYNDPCIYLGVNKHGVVRFKPRRGKAEAYLAWAFNRMIANGEVKKV